MKVLQRTWERVLEFLNEAFSYEEDLVMEEIAGIRRLPKDEQGPAWAELTLKLSDASRRDRLGI